MRDRILIVEHDPVVSDLIARQALQASGYQTFVVGEVATAISRALQVAPDVMIVDLALPGLSAKDLMVALSAQGLDIPVIVLAARNSEKDIIQAFRLGASDYLAWPVREAEVVNVVERALKMVHERRERERLGRQLQQTNLELQARVRELTTIFSIGKAVTSITDQRLLFEKILDGAVKVSQADLGWFLLRSKSSEKNFILTANRNLPPSLAEKSNQIWDDGIGSLVALSGEPLAIFGEPLRRFKIASLGSSALIMPVKAQKEVIALLTVMRKQAAPFSPSAQHLLEAVADYASISLVNSQLFHTVEDRAKQLQRAVEEAQIGERVGNDLLGQVKKELRDPLDTGLAALERLIKDPTARWTSDQRQHLAAFQDQVNYLNRVADAIPVSESGPITAEETTRVVENLRAAAVRYQHFTQPHHISLVAELPNDNLEIRMGTIQFNEVIDALLSNAVKFCNPGGRVTVHAEVQPGQYFHLTVSDTGVGMDIRQVARIFEPRGTGPLNRPKRFGGLGIRLSLVKEIITRQNGKIWVESKPGEGTQMHITLPLSN